MQQPGLHNWRHEEPHATATMKPEETKRLRSILTFSALLLALPVATLAQSAAAPSPTTPPVHHHVVHRTAHHALHHAPNHALSQEAACAPLAAAPVLPPGIPAATGTVETALALRYIDIEPGTGAPMQPGDFLTVHYTGWLASTGAKFDSSLDRNEPFTFQQGEHHVISGWDEGLNGMRVGGKRRLFIPWQLAYGEAGRESIPPRADLIFDVQLLAASPEDPGAPGAVPPATPPSGTSQR
jgi:peptidylprolyl isomerase